MKKKLLIFSAVLLFSLNFAGVFLYAESEGVGDEIGIWEIERGNLIKKGLEEEEKAIKYWNAIYKILPNEYIDNYLNSFRLYTDGEGGDLGGMNQLDETNSNWQFDLDVMDMKIFSKDKKKAVDSIHTLIHEFGHLITLNIEQIKPVKDPLESRMETYETAEGYTLGRSYLNNFVKRFWAGDILDEWFDIDGIEDVEERQDAIFDFYSYYADSFVSDYAAENPEEDIAESWTFFVLSDKPKGESVKEKKVRFFYEFPELVEYRKHIRSKIDIIPENYIETYENK